MTVRVVAGNKLGTNLVLLGAEQVWRSVSDALVDALLDAVPCGLGGVVEVVVHVAQAPADHRQVLLDQFLVPMGDVLPEVLEVSSISARS